MKLKAFIFVFFVGFFFSLEAAYISIDMLTPGQMRFSSKNVEQKIEHALKTKDAVYNENKKAYVGKYFEGRSLFPESEALPVIKAPFGLVLVDGHHHVLASLSLNLCFVPIKEIEDLSCLDENSFWCEAEKKGYVYLYDLDGNRQIPTCFSDLQDDPNRYFAAIAARKYPENKDVKKSTGAEYPLWIKIGKDTPFIEFHISDALMANGLFYSYEMGDNPPVAFIEQARKILVESCIPGLRVVPERIHYSKIPI